MKYIVVSVRRGTSIMEFPIIFPEVLVHADMAVSLSPMFLRMFPDADEIKPISVGDFSSYGMMIQPSGESETLKLKSRREDRELIAMCDYGSVFAKS